MSASPASTCSQICVGLPWWITSSTRRVAPLEGGDRLGQRVARLGVSGRYRQGAELVVGELLAGAAQVLRLGEDALGDRDHRLARLGDRDQPLAVPGEDLEPQLVLEGADLLRHAGLGGMQGLGGLRHVEPAADDLGQATELLEFHMFISNNILTH